MIRMMGNRGREELENLLDFLFSISSPFPRRAVRFQRRIDVRNEEKHEATILG